MDEQQRKQRQHLRNFFLVLGPVSGILLANWLPGQVTFDDVIDAKFQIVVPAIIFIVSTVFFWIVASAIGVRTMFVIYEDQQDEEARLKKRKP